MTDSISTADTAPATRAMVVIPSDNQALPFVPKGIYVGIGGDVTVRPVHSDADVTYRNLPDASYIAVRVSHIRATGTSADALIGEG